MLQQRLIGTIYTVAVKVEVPPFSNAEVEHFSTYDRFSDSYSWRPFENCSYLLIPCSKKGHYISMTVYIRVDKEMRAAILKRLAESILREEFFHGVSGVSIHHLDKPIVFLKPHALERRDEDESDYRAEKIIDFITHE